jgi:hypothetical protein
VPVEGTSAQSREGLGRQNSAVDLAAANATTVLGALCFFDGAVLLLPESAGA